MLGTSFLAIKAPFLHFLFFTTFVGLFARIWELIESMRVICTCRNTKMGRGNVYYELESSGSLVSCSPVTVLSSSGMILAFQA